MRFAVFKPVVAVAAAVGLMTATGCRTVMESAPLATADDHKCQSALGAYALPKTHLHVLVEGRSSDLNDPEAYLSLVEEISMADGARVYCLDYLARGSAADEIKVLRGDLPSSDTVDNAGRAKRSSSLLLSYVGSNTIDFTADIARKLIRALFIGLSGNPGFEPIGRALKAGQAFPEKPVTLGDYSFDPLDVTETALANLQLAPLGFCVVLQNYSFDPDLSNAERYCNDPLIESTTRAKFAVSYAAYETADDAPAKAPGVVYRPRQPFSLFVYTKDDPKGSEKWRLVRTMTVRLENIAPVVSIGVDRGAFAKRRTGLLFDRGVLVGMCISKTSEVLAALEIPLEIVRSIAALPAQAIKIQISSTGKSAALLNAETSLLRLQQEYLAYLANPLQAPRPMYGQGFTEQPKLPRPKLNLPDQLTSGFITDQDFGADCTGPKEE